LKTRKFMAILVAVAMIVTMLPMVALAAPTKVKEVSATIKVTAFTSDTITADVTYTVELDDAAASGGQKVYVRLMDESDSVIAEKDVTVAAGRTTASVIVSNVALSWKTTYTVEADFVDAFNSPAKATATLTTPANTSDYSAAGSSVAVNKTTVDVGQAVTFTVRFRDAAGLIPNQPVKFWVKSSRDAEIITEINGDADHASIPSGYLDVARAIEAITTNNSTVTFTVKSSVAGDATISIYKLDNTSFDADDALLIGKETITFESDKDVAVVELAVDKEDLNDDGTATAGKSFDLIATVLDGQDYWVEDEEVTFYEYYKENKGDKYGSRKKIGTADTDKYGEAELSVRRDKAGFYAFYARANGNDSAKGKPGDSDAEAKGWVIVEVVPASAYRVEAKDDVKYAELDEEVEVKFVYYDRYGSKRAVSVDKDDDVEILDPNGKELKAKDFDIEWDKGELKVIFTPDKEGEYVVRVYIPDTGIYAETVVNTTEFGEVEKLGLKLYDETDTDKIDNAAVKIYDDDDNIVSDYQVRVYEYDKNGIERRVDASDVYFSTSDARIATVDKDGMVTLKKDASGVVTITAVHEESELSGTLDIIVSGSPVGIDVEVAVDDLEAEVELKYVDENGNLAVEDEDKEGYRVYAGDLEVDDQDDFKNGKASFVLLAEEYGTYSVRVVTDEGLSETFDVTFSEKEEKPAAGKVVLTIGANFGLVDGAVTELDAPAFIAEGRTFVPVRFIAEALGAEADWEPKDAAVETVFLTWDDMEIIIGIGDEFLTVTKDGEAEVFEFDGAARIVDGRTFLPFRAIGEAFGVTVDYGPKDGPVEWVSFE
jgi:hypothetical protein